MTERPRVVGAPTHGLRLLAVSRPGGGAVGPRVHLDAGSGLLWIALGAAEGEPSPWADGEGLVVVVDPREGRVSIARSGPGAVFVERGSGAPRVVLGEGAEVTLDEGTSVVLAWGVVAPVLEDAAGAEALLDAAVAGGGQVMHLCVVAADDARATHHLELELACELDAIEVVNAAFDRFAADHEVPAGVRRTFDIAFDDLINNVVSYGFPGVAEEVRRESLVTVRVSLDGVSVEAELADSGVAYDPFAREAPDTELDLDDREIGGLGVHLVKSMMDDVAYARRGDRNVITLRKSISPT